MMIYEEHMLNVVFSKIKFLGKHILTETCATCKQLRGLGAKESGLYIVYPESHPDGMTVFCDMETDGGGWTLMWSNIRGRNGRATTRMNWADATGAETFFNGTPSNDKHSFEVYSGLSLWNEFMGRQDGGEVRYEWRHPTSREILQDAKMKIQRFNAGDNFTLRISDITHLVGTVAPGLLTYHNNRQFSAYGADHDDYRYPCSNYYSYTPWWYSACWSGNISGGGEYGGNGYGNGAFWRSSTTNGSFSDGDSYGDGWLWIR